MRRKILLPVAFVLGLFAIQPALTNAAYAQASSSTTATKPAPAKKAAAKKPAMSKTS